MHPTEIELARRYAKTRAELIVHVGVYLAANIGLFAIWWFSETDYPWFVWPMLGWGMAIAYHVTTLLLGPRSERKWQAADRELRRLPGHRH